ncbi:hypothetical protein BMW23_0004 [Bodo saltans virus]|uniref:Uncharacterized protein n=1 Tax=Bodo saltans virus TaxID=2024608 RepID=A0A2H4UT95_9VIRU|nr:hypothetical protein QJ851_gp0004 [Bodo saltans virus]ATZ80067.1 hypothetical protein BMW23_0004 [Bodo saltans virus]
MDFKKNIIKVYNDTTIDFFLKKSDVAKKYNFSSQHIGNILNGKTKKKYIVYNEKILHIKYVNDNDVDKYKEKNEENIKDPYDYFFSFFNKYVTKTENKKDYVTVIDIYNNFRCNYYYLERDKNIKAKFLTYKNIKKICETDKIIGLSFKKKFDRTINDKRIMLTNVLIGYKLNNEDLLK